ncbi:MAG: methionyl-tRNA formyltransferase [Gammaproteobacteria bacterium]|nr:methionyl-tRNA formyltransferase [Gammaproteobacteria bacterium]
MSLRVIFAGTPEFATYPLQALIHSEHQVVAAFTQPDRPAGRGNKLTPPPVKVLAEQYGIPVHQPLSLKTPEAQALVSQYEADVMVVVAYGLLLPQAVLDMPRYGCLNIHGSLLPRWRGAAPIARAIEAGDKQTGIDIMKMDAGLDTGDILARAVLPILASDTQQQVHDSLAPMGAHLLMAVLSDLPHFLANAKTQPSEGICYAHKLSKAEAKIDWTQGATQIVRKIRAFAPWPGSFCHWGEQILKVGIATVVNEQSSQPAGWVIGLSEQGLLVNTADGVIALQQLQRTGGKMLPVHEFNKGCDLTGQQLS